MYIGESEKRICRVSLQADNGSVIETGKSGSGKSCRMNKIELAEVEDGNTIIAVDISRNHREQFVLPEIRDKYACRVNRINLVKDGLDLKLLRPLVNQEKETEHPISVINSNVVAFSSTMSMGVRQRSILREAIILAIQVQQQNGCTDAEALIASFEMNKQDLTWNEVYQRLWAILNCGALRGGQKNLRPQAINIIDFGDLDADNSAEQMAEVIIAYYWRMARCSGFPEDMGKVTLVIDEFQHLSLGKDSTLRRILCEGRRFGLNLLLATQSLELFSREVKAVLNQTATHLYFHPVDSEVASSAKVIDPLAPKDWVSKLLGLKKGECVATGYKDIAGVTISRPLILR